MDPSQDDCRPNTSSDENADKDSDDKNAQTTSKAQSKHKAKRDLDSYNDENILEQLGNLEVSELDNIVSFADNIAMKLAIQTTMKVQSLGQN